MPAPVEDGRLVRVGHRLLPLDGLTLGAMTPTPPTLLQTDPAAARERLARDGYLLLRGVLPAATVERACAATCAVLAEAGWLKEGTDPEKRIANPNHASPELELRMNGYSISGPGLADKGSSMRAGAAGGQMYGKYHELYNHPDMRAVLHSKQLFDVAAALFGEAAGALDYRWMRAVLPDMLVGHGYHMGAPPRPPPPQVGADPVCTALRQRVHGPRLRPPAYLLAAAPPHRPRDGRRGGGRGLELAAGVCAAARDLRDAGAARDARPGPRRAHRRADPSSPSSFPPFFLTTPLAVGRRIRERAG